MAKLKFMSDFKKGFNYEQIPIYEVRAESGEIYDKLPYTFVEGHTSVNIAISTHENCPFSFEVIKDLDEIPHEHYIFEGCLLYKKGKIRFVQGIYDISSTPLISIDDIEEGLIDNPDEMKEFVFNLITSIPRIANMKLLIKFNDYSVKIYSGFKKGRKIKFPVVAEQAQLKVLLIPRPHRYFDYQVTNKIRVEDHKLVFDKEVTRFLIDVYRGDAEMIYNHNDSNVNMEIQSEDFGSVRVNLEPKRVYLIAHPDGYCETQVNQKS
ncbi:MAG: hypothetical protein JHC26_05830 [Thermofilum sp.]|uniref:hypothetical protein n=1 Tax=Thermofilum sp. TaxID=1961369 RepID=UPI00258F5BCC|nr:hypothetical protein [Thermofilum sp.]MCI4408591.1 hypothetical protein [Thermofilum sp.]